MAQAAASTPGSMSAVKKNPTKLQELLKDWNEALGTDVVVANHNSPVQSVISGSTQDIEKIEQKCSEEGLTAQRLGVSTAFHSKIVAGAVPEFADFLETCSFQKPIYLCMRIQPPISIRMMLLLYAQPYPIKSPLLFSLLMKLKRCMPMGLRYLLKWDLKIH